MLRTTLSWSPCPRLPSVIAITAMLLMIYSLYRLRATAPGARAWPVIFALLTLYGIVAALAPGDGTSRGVLLSIGFATLTVYTWLDSARTTPAFGRWWHRAVRG